MLKLMLKYYLQQKRKCWVVRGRFFETVRQRQSVALLPTFKFFFRQHGLCDKSFDTCTLRTARKNVPFGGRTFHRSFENIHFFTEKTKNKQGNKRVKKVTIK